MQIVINLSDSVYDAIKNKYTLVNPKEGTLIKTLWDAIEDGTPLPKGHGDLVTKEQMIDLVEFYQLNPQHFDFVNLINEIRDAKPIIEADRSEE